MIMKLVKSVSICLNYSKELAHYAQFKSMAQSDLIHSTIAASEIFHDSLSQTRWSYSILDASGSLFQTPLDRYRLSDWEHQKLS